MNVVLERESEQLTDAERVALEFMAGNCDAYKLAHTWGAVEAWHRLRGF